MHRAVLPLVLLGAGTACLWQGEPAGPGGVDIRLTILHTADMHSRLLPVDRFPDGAERALGLDPRAGPLGGAARLAGLIARERARAARVLTLDAGGALGGGPLFAVYGGEPELRFLSDAGVDAMALGDHALDAGGERLVDRLARFATFPVLAANYDFAPSGAAPGPSLIDVTAPFALRNVGGVRLAIIGLSDLGDARGAGQRREANETLRFFVNLLHGSTDLVVVLSQLSLARERQIVLGYETTVAGDDLQSGWEVRERFNDGRVLAHVPGVRSLDAIIGGRSHVTTNPPLTLTDADGRRVLVAHAGSYGEILGRLDLVLRDDLERGGKRIISHAFAAFPVDARLVADEDATVAGLLAPYFEGSTMGLDRVIGHAPAIIRRFATGTGGDSALGNLIAAAARSSDDGNSGGADAAIIAAADLGADLRAGPLAVARLYDLIPFDARLWSVRLRGDELQALADEITTRSAARGCASIAEVAGIELRLNCGRVVDNERAPFQHPAEAIEINGEPLAGDRSYRVVLDDRALGWLDGPAAQASPPLSLRECVTTYVAAMSACGEIEVSDPGRAESEAFADLPCVVSSEDGRLQRRSAPGLDALPDAGGAAP